MPQHDVVIVGGGPAGSSAALILARCRRSVVVLDAAEPRNRRAQAMHGFLTRDGIAPPRFLSLAREEAQEYGAMFLHDSVARARRDRSGFCVATTSGRTLHSRALLIATGVVDVLPSLSGIDRFYGASVHHCPYCDGWQWRDRKLAAFGHGSAAAGMALGLRAWSDDVIAFFNGPANLSAPQRRRLARCGVQVCEKPIARLAGRGRKLRQVVLVDGTTMPRDALFFNTAQHDRSVLLQQLGCAFGRDGRVRVDRREQTGVPGLFVAGDVLREVQFVIVAAGHGATAAVGIHQYLQSLDGFTFDDLKRHPKGTA